MIRFSLIEKEWRQVRWFFLAGLVLFAFFPLLMILLGERVNDSLVTGISEIFCGVFAIFVGVGLVSQDLGVGLTAFWRSKPVGIRRWVITKYFAGLFAVLGSFSFPIVVCLVGSYPALRLDYFDFILSMLGGYTFLVLLLYSFSFFISWLFREAIYAVMFSVIFGLVLYFLPLLFEPLHSFSIFYILQDVPIDISDRAWHSERVERFTLRLLGWHKLRLSVDFLRYVIFSLSGGAVCLFLSVAAVKRNLQLKVGLKSLFWSVGVTGLFLFSVFALEVGNNLEVVRRFSPGLLNGKQVWLGTIITEGNGGYLCLRQARRSYLRRFSLSGDELEFGPFIAFGNDERNIWQVYLWQSPSVGSSDLICYVKGDVIEKDPAGVPTKYKCYFYIGELSEEQGRVKDLGEICLGEVEGSSIRGITGREGTVYVNIWHKVFVIDISEPSEPRVKRELRMPTGGFHIDRRTRDFNLELLDLEGLSPEERLAISTELGIGSWGSDYDDKRIVSMDWDYGSSYFISLFELTGFEGGSAKFEKLSEYYPNRLMRLLGLQQSEELIFHNDLLYVRNQGRRGSISVYDVSGGRIERVGYYTTAGGRIRTMGVLDNRYILIGRGFDILEMVKSPEVGSD